ncbi:MAG: BamA/TamA family outer membrane protein [Myxococcota bacterium]
MLALLLALAPAAGWAQEPGEYDPWQGIDPNGRIPAIEKPDDLPNPDKWRYIPEGRIKPGNVFQRFLVSSIIAPFVFHDSDVGTGFGVTAVDIDFRQQRRRELGGVWASYTTEGQQNYSFFWRRWLHHREVPTGGVLQEERSFVRASGGYTRTLTRRFFGLGPGTDESDETSYRDETTYAEVGFERAWPEPGDPLVWGAGLRGETHSLGPGHVSGEPNTKDVHPFLFRDADRTQQGWALAEVRYDTRDSQRNPYRGWAVGADVATALAQTHGDVGAVFGLFGTKIVPVPSPFHDGGDPDEEHPPTDVVALSLRGRLASGNLPFFAQPMLGGAAAHRGFIAGRFRDRGSWIGGIEHRFWFLPRGFKVPFTDAIHIERVGAAAFYEIGAVFPNESELFTSRIRQSYGIGLRLSLERAAPFRLDFGFSEDGVNINARFGLAF